MILFYILFYFIIIKSIESLSKQDINFQIIQSPVFDPLPKIKLHHIVLLSNNKSSGLYAIDFSPFYQNNKKTLLKLLFGYNVDAEIRIRYLSKYFLHNTNKFIDKWYSMNPNDPTKSKIITNNILDFMCLTKNSDDCNIQYFIKEIISKWKSSMNLYNHNCQHFSNFVKKELMIY